MISPLRKAISFSAALVSGVATGSAAAYAYFNANLTQYAFRLGGEYGRNGVYAMSAVSFAIPALLITIGLYKYLNYLQAKQTTT